jgi:molecular chaperone GrpE (heat shock protein)
MEATHDPMTEGVKLIYQKLVSILESKGLKPMKSIGKLSILNFMKLSPKFL